MIDVVNCITFLWLTGWAFYSLRSLARGDRRSIHFVLLVFFLFCALPLAFDVAIGMPAFIEQPNYLRVTRDPTTCLVYCGWMAMVPPLCLLVRPNRSRRRPAGENDSRSPRLRPLARFALYALTVSPTICLPLAPDPGLYLTYGAFVSGDTGPQEMDFHHRLSAVCLLVAVAVPALVIASPRLRLETMLFFGVTLGQAFWLHGKRSIVMIALVGLLYALWARGILRGRRLWAAGAMALLGVALFTFFYQKGVRGIDLADASFYFDSVRVDFARDAVIKQAIAAELMPSDPILEYRGQSLLFDLTFFVPRRIWPEKPWPYAVYATSAMLNIPAANDIGWGITTSLLDESLANFGWLGMVLAPLLLGWLCRLGDSAGGSFTRPLTVVIGSLLLVLHLPAFMLSFLCWCGLVLNGHLSQRRRGFRVRQQPFQGQRWIGTRATFTSRGGM